VKFGNSVANSSPKVTDGDDAPGATRSGTTNAARHDPPLAQQLPRPGTRLVREWNGRSHFVDVSEDGFVFDGKTYRSLSAIAKRITGAHWSGPRFFGL
jgi:hypothetical protein